MKQEILDRIQQLGGNIEDFFNKFMTQEELIVIMRQKLDGIS